MAIGFTPGEGAFGATNAKRGNHSRTHDVARDDARIERLEARLDALESLVQGLAGIVKSGLAELVAELEPLKALLVETESRIETVSVSPITANETPWLAAGVSRATWFRKKKAMEKTSK